MRKGELLGLRKADLDLDGRTILVARSYDRETTKGGHVAVIPMAESIVPVPRRAAEESPSELVFPPRGEDRRVAPRHASAAAIH
jgi:integrase